jgi:hypothetical protein
VERRRVVRLKRGYTHNTEGRAVHKIPHALYTDSAFASKFMGGARHFQLIMPVKRGKLKFAPFMLMLSEQELTTSYRYANLMCMTFMSQNTFRQLKLISN